MATAKKLPSGNWRVNLFVGYDDNGKRKYKSFTAETKKEAEFMAASYNLSRKEKPKGLTVGDAIDGYIQSKENVLSETSIATYKQMRRLRFQQLMDVPLDKLTNIMIQQAINAEAARLSPKSVRSAHGLLSAALGMYLPDFMLRTTLPAKQHKIKDLPTAEQVMQAVAESAYELPALLALCLGLRMSEVRGIRYKDLSGNTLTVQHVRIQYGNQTIAKDQAKTYDSTRQLTVPDFLVSKIGNGEPDNYIVNFSQAAIEKNIKKLVKNISGKDITFHDLRHINASTMLALGVPDKYAMERGGWSSNNTLKTIYQHTFSDARQEIDTKINDYFSAMQHKMQHD